MKAAFLSLILLLFCAGGCTQGAECLQAADCAAPGDGLCLDGQCLVFGPEEFAEAVVDISFPRDMISIPKSGLIYILHARTSDGSLLDCTHLESHPQLVSESRVNHLLVEPRRLLFNCCGNFFPDNLVQRIRPADKGLLLGLAFPTIEPDGEFSALGCVGDLTLVSGQRTELLLSFRAR